MINRYDDIESVLQLACALPDFPGKQHIVNCLEKRNVNDYGRALELINEFEHDPAASPPPLPALRQKLE